MILIILTDRADLKQFHCETSVLCHICSKLHLHIAHQLALADLHKVSKNLCHRVPVVLEDSIKRDYTRTFGSDSRKHPVVFYTECRCNEFRMRAVRKDFSDLSVVKVYTFVTRDLEGTRTEVKGIHKLLGVSQSQFCLRELENLLWVFRIESQRVASVNDCLSESEGQVDDSVFRLLASDRVEVD